MMVAAGYLAKRVAVGPEWLGGAGVVVPKRKVLAGYDVATFYGGGKAECSPLSCNGLAGEVGANEHCLLDSWERAKELLEGRCFDNSEPGPLRVFAVYRLGGRGD